MDDDNSVELAMDAFSQGNPDPFYDLLRELPRNDRGWKRVKKILSMLSGLYVDLFSRLSEYEDV